MRTRKYSEEKIIGFLRQADQGTLTQAQAELQATMGAEVATVVALGLEAYSGQ